MKGVNKCILLGLVGQDPEVKFMPSGDAVTNISLATSEKWKQKGTGNPMEKTEWHTVVFFGALAEIVGEYIKKGSKVYVEGALRTRKWQAQDGTDRYRTEIVASEMQMLDGKPQENQSDSRGNGAGNSQSNSGYADASAARSQPKPKYTNQPQQQQPRNNAAAQQSYQQPQQQNGFDSFDDSDIPF